MEGSTIFTAGELRTVISFSESESDGNDSSSDVGTDIADSIAVEFAVELCSTVSISPTLDDISTVNDGTDSVDGVFWSLFTVHNNLIYVSYSRKICQL